MRGESWFEWQQQVVTTIRDRFFPVLHDIDDSDVDWEAWRPLYEEGRSPQNAVARAFAQEHLL